MLIDRDTLHLTIRLALARYRATLEADAWEREQERREARIMDAIRRRDVWKHRHTSTEGRAQ